MEDRQLKRIEDILAGFKADFKLDAEVVIENKIESTVNGKIRLLTSKLDDYIELDKAWKAEDMAWKDQAQPVVSTYKNLRWLLSDFALGGLKVLGLIAVGIGGWKVLTELFTK
jgi:hypothetical protein